jgi:hypothetical protein
LTFRRADAGKVLADLQARVMKPTHEFDAKIEAIERDRHLAPEGKQAQKHSAGLALLGAVEAWFKEHHDGLAGAERHVRAELSPLIVATRPSDPAAALEQALVRQEVRSRAQGMSEEQREQLYRQGNSIIRAALDEMPSIASSEEHGTVSVRPFVKPEVRERLREEALQEVARRQRPDLADMLDDITTTRQAYTLLAGSLKQHVLHQAPRPAGPSPDGKPDLTGVAVA